MYICIYTHTNTHTHTYAYRDDEVCNEKIGVPQGARVLLGDIFKKYGVEVHYCCEDKYDTVVAYAVRDDASILGHSREYFRYQGTLVYAHGAPLPSPEKLGPRMSCSHSGFIVISSITHPLSLL
jgi:hypothetical protein